MPDPDFLQSFPLYKKFSMKVPIALAQLPRPPLNMFCGRCSSPQTFTMQGGYGEPLAAVLSSFPEPAAGRLAKAVYRCAACNQYERTFYLRFSEDLAFVEKVGQYPPWRIKIDRALAKTLGKWKSLFKKGLACEAQSYGIGAFAYYRRIIEDIIESLLNQISDLLEGGDKAGYDAKLEEAKRTHVAQKKIELVKDHLPVSLRPGGMNPLAVLHEALSSGIHSESDEECVKFAEAIRRSLTYLVEQVSRKRHKDAEYATALKTLLDEKSRRKKRQQGQDGKRAR